MLQRPHTVRQPLGFSLCGGIEIKMCHLLVKLGILKSNWTLSESKQVTRCSQTLWEGLNKLFIATLFENVNFTSPKRWTYNSFWNFTKFLFKKMVSSLFQSAVRQQFSSVLQKDKKTAPSMCSVTGAWTRPLFDWQCNWCLLEASWKRYGLLLQIFCFNVEQRTTSRWPNLCYQWDANININKIKLLILILAVPCTMDEFTAWYQSRLKKNCLEKLVSALWKLNIGSASFVVKGRKIIVQLSFWLA